VNEAISNSARMSNLPSVPRTVSLRQIVVDSGASHTFKYRDVSCFCGGLSNCCDCYEPKCFAFAECTTVVSEVASTDTCTVRPTSEGAGVENDKIVQPAFILNESVVGKFCVVTYDKKPYPGKILSVKENDIEVDYMHAVRNKMRMYFTGQSQFQLIPEPSPISDHGRSSLHFAVDATIWDDIVKGFV